MMEKYLSLFNEISNTDFELQNTRMFMKTIVPNLFVNIRDFRGKNKEEGVLTRISLFF
ncbi:MAG: hypothetical protein LBF88_09380 [Planctomycetaceae bacterium]|jgi:hypothetical protein|nr:hypothetical protein [Planctomycetaceae bacterium]